MEYSASLLKARKKFPSNIYTGIYTAGIASSQHQRLLTKYLPNITVSSLVASCVAKEINSESVPRVQPNFCPGSQFLKQKLSYLPFSPMGKKKKKHICTSCVCRILLSNYPMSNLANLAIYCFSLYCTLPLPLCLFRGINIRFTIRPCMAYAK